MSWATVPTLPSPAPAIGLIGIRARPFFSSVVSGDFHTVVNSMAWIAQPDNIKGFGVVVVMGLYFEGR
jgi:hypothetical protein